MSATIATLTVLKSGAWGARVKGSVAVDDELEVVSESGAVKRERVAKVISTNKRGESVCMTKEIEPDHRQVLIRMALGVLARKEPSLADEIRAIIPDHVDDKMDLLCARNVIAQALRKTTGLSEGIANTQAVAFLSVSLREAEQALPKNTTYAERKKAWLAYINDTEEVNADDTAVGNGVDGIKAVAEESQVAKTAPA